jgi:hypothetical protein
MVENILTERKAAHNIKLTHHAVLCFVGQFDALISSFLLYIYFCEPA